MLRKCFIISLTVEKHKEFIIETFCFIDYVKAFDRIKRDVL
jgi:hypothetical protein